jgi:hypothetical protein
MKGKERQLDSLARLTKNCGAAVSSQCFSILNQQSRLENRFCSADLSIRMSIQSDFLGHDPHWGKVG